MQTAAEMRAEVTRRAAADPAVREALKERPQETIGELIGVRLPDRLQVHVHEESERTGHLVLPPPSRLDADALEQVSAGFSSAPEQMNVLNW